MTQEAYAPNPLVFTIYPQGAGQDDSFYIRQAVEQARAVGGTVAWAGGAYIWNSPTPLQWYPTVGSILEGPSVVTAGAAATSHFIEFSVSSSKCQQIDLPAIVGFSGGAGLYFNGVVLNAQPVYTPWIQGCKWGIVFDASNADCNNCAVRVDVIDACTFGVLYTSSSATNQLQSCFVRNAYIVNCTTAALKHDYASTNPGVVVINGLLDVVVDGQDSTTYGFQVTTGTPVQFFTLRALYFHNFATAIIECAGSGSIIWSTLDFGLSSLPAGYAAWAWGSGGEQNVSPNKITSQNSLDVSAGLGTAALAAQTSANSRSSFGGGSAYPYRMIPIAIPVSNGSAGTSQTVYVYHPWVVGGVSQLRFFVQAVNTARSSVVEVSDNSATNPNEVAIVVDLLNTVSGGTQYIYGYLEVGL